MRDPEFSGYWSEHDKELWQSIDWKARNYEEYPVEDSQDPINGIGYFYTMKGTLQKPVRFIKYLRPNPIYPPYYGPIYDSELLEFMKQGGFCYPCYDGRKEGPYDIHDRFESSDLADMLSR